MYYKLLSYDRVVDVGENPVYVRWQQRNGIFIPVSGAEKANGILSQDGSEIYHISGRPEIPAGGHASVVLVEIPEEEYAALGQRLDMDAAVLETGETGEEEEPAVMTISQMRNMLLEQEKLLQQLWEKLQAERE